MAREDLPTPMEEATMVAGNWARDMEKVSSLGLIRADTTETGFKTTDMDLENLHLLMGRDMLVASNRARCMVWDN